MNKVNNVGLNLINRTIENNQNEGLNSKRYSFRTKFST